MLLAKQASVMDFGPSSFNTMFLTCSFASLQGNAGTPPLHDALLAHQAVLAARRPSVGGAPAGRPSAVQRSDASQGDEPLQRQIVVPKAKRATCRCCCEVRIGSYPDAHWYFQYACCMCGASGCVSREPAPDNQSVAWFLRSCRRRGP